MRPELIYGGAVAAGETVQYTVSKGHLNGLLVFGDKADLGAKITVKRNTAKKCYVLSANVSASHFSRVSDLEHGATSSGTELGFGAYMVELGSLYLGPSNELEVIITFSVAANVRVYGASYKRVPDHMIQWDIISDRESHLSNVRAVYLSAAPGAALFSYDEATGAYTGTADVTVQLEDGSDTTICDVPGFVALATVVGRSESSPQDEAVAVYVTPDGVPSSLYLKVSGDDAGTVNVIVQRTVMDRSSVSKNTVAAVRRNKERVQKIEKDDPETAKALRHAGVIAPSAKLAVVEAAAEQG